MKWLLLALPALTWAGTAQADKAYDRCVDRSSTNSAWSVCGGAYLQRLDRALNAAWKRANVRLDPPARARLLAEQRAWLKFRDASCQLQQSGYFGREGQVLHYATCRASIIEARIRDLTAIAELGG